MTWLVAFVLALCVPFGQLRTSGDRIECCCPDQSTCKCPDHKADTSGQPSMRACHKETHRGIANQLASFVPPALPAMAAPTIVHPAPLPLLAAPHEAPAPRRPDAPS